MAELIAHNNERIETIYQLLGTKENDITRAIAWTLKKCPTFLNAFIHFSRFGMNDITSSNITIFYQQFEKTESENGYTDLEITDYDSFHIILEAKRGWILPGHDQLKKYADRDSFKNRKIKNKFIVTVSECSYEYAKNNLPFEKTETGIPVFHISWKELKALSDVARAGANHEQKHLLEEFSKYLGGLMSMKNEMSNEVYVVSLSQKKIGNTSFSFVDIVNKTGHYFCPVGINGYPKEAPNYIGFRYNGKLQSIHHIDKYKITKNIHDVIDEMPDENWDKNHFVFNLGPAIIPQKTVRSGRIRNTRIWAMIDTLLTCDTISDACRASKMRKMKQE